MISINQTGQITATHASRFAIRFSLTTKVTISTYLRIQRERSHTTIGIASVESGPSRNHISGAGLFVSTSEERIHTRSEIVPIIVNDTVSDTVFISTMNTEVEILSVK